MKEANFTTDLQSFSRNLGSILVTLGCFWVGFLVYLSGQAGGLLFGLVASISPGLPGWLAIGVGVRLVKHPSKENIRAAMALGFFLLWFPVSFFLIPAPSFVFLGIIPALCLLGYVFLTRWVLNRLKHPNTYREFLTNGFAMLCAFAVWGLGGIIMYVLESLFVSTANGPTGELLVILYCVFVITLGIGVYYFVRAQGQHRSLGLGH